MKNLSTQTAKLNSLTIGTDTPEREIHVKSPTGAQIKLESTSSADWSGIDFSGKNGEYSAYFGLEDPTGNFVLGLSGNNFIVNDQRTLGGSGNDGAKLYIDDDMYHTSNIRDFGNGDQWARTLFVGNGRDRESNALDRVDAIHVISSCTQYLSGTRNFTTNLKGQAFHPEGGAYWACPAIYRSADTSGSYPFDKWGELILQGTSYGTGYNRGVTIATWDEVDGNIAEPRMRVSENGIQSFSQPFASVKLNDDNSQGGQNKTVGPPGGGAVIESSDLVNIEFETIDVNRGNVWDQANRRFVAPVAGDYQISFNSNIAVWNMGSSTGLNTTTYFAVYITKNGVTWARAYNNKLASDTYEKWTHVSLTYDIPLQANDYVSVALWCSSGYIWADSDGNYTTASFRLLG